MSKWISGAMQKIEPVNEKEIDWIKRQLESARRFVEDFSPTEKRPQLTLDELDSAFAAWIFSNPTDVKSVNAIINCVGVAFGQFLADGLDLSWVIATDDHGSELALHGLPAAGDVLIYPANFVAKRWERREINFLAEAYRRIAHDVQTAAKHNPRRYPN
jgi:Domain of unknown function (DUF3806)